MLVGAFILLPQRRTASLCALHLSEIPAGPVPKRLTAHNAGGSWALQQHDEVSCRPAVQRWRWSGPGSSVAQHRLQVAHMLLGLLEQRSQGLSHVGQVELDRLTAAHAVALELVGLQAQVGLEGHPAFL